MLARLQARQGLWSIGFLIWTKIDLRFSGVVVKGNSDEMWNITAVRSFRMPGSGECTGRHGGAVNRGGILLYRGRHFSWELQACFQVVHRSIFSLPALRVRCLGVNFYSHAAHPK